MTGVKQGLLDGSAFNYTDRKEYQYVELGIKLNEYNIKRYKLSKIPTFRLGAFYNTIAQQNEFTYFKNTPGKIWYPSSALTLSIMFPFFMVSKPTQGLQVQNWICKKVSTCVKT
jgi:hypothetical protein